jgi:alkylation response protein AidB-like acyl-CoA dehydrogenase
MFFLDMKSPGVDVRPIRQANGESEFNDVFFTDVRIPDAQRLGGVNEGWGAVITTLMFERFSAGGGLNFAGWEDIMALARASSLQDPPTSTPAIQDGRVREAIADAWLNEKGLFLNNCRAVTALSRGQTPGPEFSIGKLVAARNAQQTAYLLFDLLGADGVRMQPAAESAPPSLFRAWMWGAAMRIAGGSEEIMRNIISERVLGLPPDIRVDKTAPFNELKG